MHEPTEHWDMRPELKKAFEQMDAARRKTSEDRIRTMMKYMGVVILAAVSTYTGAMVSDAAWRGREPRTPMVKSEREKELENRVRQLENQLQQQVHDRFGDLLRPNPQVREGRSVDMLRGHHRDVTVTDPPQSRQDDARRKE